MTELTVLNRMADPDFDRAVAQHVEWGLHWMDLRDGIYDKGIAELDVATAERAKAAIDAAGLEVYCLSSPIMNDHIEKGEAHFRVNHIDRIAAMADTVRILRPKYFRLLAAEFEGRRPGETMTETLQREHPWVIPAYREAIDRVAELGVAVTIENEWRNCIITTADDAHAFFDAVDRKGVVGYTWDVQNQWTSGFFPSVAEYRRMSALIQYVHLKGGQYADPVTRELAWRAGLAEASWPVREIVQAVLDDAVSPVICLNPSHGELKASYDYDYATVTKRDIDFLRAEFEGIV